MKYYRQLRKTVSDTQYKLIPADKDVYEFLDLDDDKDYYTSIYEYNQNQYWEFQKTGTVAGITEVTTPRLVFDFDNKEDLQSARADAIVLCTNLKKLYNVPENAIQISFSGSKGFCVALETDKRFTVQEFKNITQHLSRGLQSFDKVVSDPNRILRVVGTKHPKSGLYKFPLTLEQLSNLNVDKIKELALDRENAEAEFNNYPTAKISDKLYNLRKTEEKILKVVDNSEIIFSQKAKGFSNCKWALSQGYQVKSGDRKIKLVALVATCKGLYFTKEQAYYMAKNAYEKGMERYGGDPFEKEELWEDIVERVYSPTWNGGIYSCRDHKTPWLSELCESLGRHKCQTSDLEVVTTEEVFDLFSDYAINFEKNVLLTGITSLDENCKFLVGTSNGILAPPGVGKTTMSLSVLNHNSLLGNQCVFFSYDMFHSMVYLRLVQKHFNYHQDKIFDIFKHDKKKANEIREKISQEYENVHFCFKSGQTADEIYETILNVEEKSGKKVKLGLVDYNELVISGISDPTQSSAQVAQRLRQIANDASICMVTLLQPSKIFSNPSDEITTYQGAKGSGAIAQSLSLMLSLSRPGFHPRHPESDKFLTINALKHRQGPLFTIDLGWDGLSGQIRELTDEEYGELKQIREKRDAENNANVGF